MGEKEIRAIQADLRRLQATDGNVSLSYIAGVLRGSGARVDYDDRYLDPLMEEPYASRLDGALRFRDFASAEESLRRLDAAYREYREASDRVGTSLVRSLVLKGKQRAESLGANPRVNPQKRREKQEIALWFHVWLETPDLFFDWLELRKQSEEFQRQFLNHHGRLSSSPTDDA
ncbi:MAG: DUF4385 family protein [Acidobacteriia bacterium]|nr:DUF4385 family protein [Terriglobia bacterium]